MKFYALGKPKLFFYDIKFILGIKKIYIMASYVHSIRNVVRKLLLYKTEQTAIFKHGLVIKVLITPEPERVKRK